MASLLLCQGPGVGPTVAIGEELGLQVNAKGAGKGKVSCVVVQPDGSEVEAEVVENEDGTFDIFYTAPEPGSYVIYVRFGGENIPRSPFKVMVSLHALFSANLQWENFLRTRGGRSEGLVVFLKCRICLAVRRKQKKGPMCAPSFYQLSQLNRRQCAILPGSDPAGGCGQRALIFPH